MLCASSAATLSASLAEPSQRVRSDKSAEAAHSVLRSLPSEPSADEPEERLVEGEMLDDGEHNERTTDGESPSRTTRPWPLRSPVRFAGIGAFPGLLLSAVRRGSAGKEEEEEETGEQEGVDA